LPVCLKSVDLIRFFRVSLIHIRFGIRLEIDHIAEIFLLCQYFTDGGAIPAEWIFVALFPAAVETLRFPVIERSQNLFLFQHATDLIDAVPGEAHIVNAPDYLGRFLVDDPPLGIFCAFHITIRRLTERLAGVSAYTVGHSDFFACVTNVPFIHDISERGKFILALKRIDAIVYRQKSHVVIGKIPICVISNLEIIPAEPGHILYDDRSDLSLFNGPKHALEALSFKCRTAYSIVDKSLRAFVAVVGGVFLQQLLLILDAVGLALQIIVW